MEFWASSLRTLNDFIRKELRTQYAGSVLGRLWWFFSPFFQMALYALVFGAILKSRPMVGDIEVPYVVYLCTGLLPWSAWSAFLARSPQLFLDNSQYIKKIRIPKAVFVVQSAVVAFIPFLMALPLFLFLSWLLGVPPTLGGVLGLSGLTVLGLILCMGIALSVSYLSVFLRDIAQLLPLLLQAVFWSLPICYSQTMVSGSLQQVLSLNPFTGLVHLSHSAFLNHQLSGWGDVAHVVVMTAVYWALGLFVMHRTDKWVVDEL